MPRKPKSILTPKWQAALKKGWLDQNADDEEIDYALSPDSGDETNALKLSDYRLGNYVIIPTMSDDSESYVRVLAAVGFVLEREFDIPVSNSDCTTLVFVEIPDFEGPRALLVACGFSSLNWQNLLT